MRSPGLVNLVVTYESPIGVPVQVDSVSAYVYSSTGFLRAYVSPTDPLILEVSNPFWQYQINDFDVSNPLLYPGFHVDVKWTIDIPGSPSPTVTVDQWTVHSFVPTNPNPFKSKLLSWGAVSPTGLMGYYIESKLPADPSFSFLGTTPYTTYVDNRTFSTVFDSKNVSYQVYGLYSNPTTGSPELGTVFSPALKQSAKGLCLVVGDITTITDVVEEVDFIRFLVHEKDAPVNVGPTYFIRSREVKIAIDSAGSFSVPLVQGTIVVAEIPEIGYTKKFIVPDRALMNLSDIPASHIEMYRAP